MEAFSKNLIVIGFRGAGKSTLSERYASMLGWKRYSTDEMISRTVGESIAGFVRKHGWAEFRAIEHAVIVSLRDAQSCVIDCGGGVVEKPENMHILKEMGSIVWVDASLSDITARLLSRGNDEQRPLLTHNNDARSDIEQHYHRRRPLYAEYARLIVNTSISSIDECCAMIQQSLQIDQRY